MSDRCFPHGARACRRCETTTGEHLDADQCQGWRERAEFWWRGDPSLYGKDAQAFAFAFEVIQLCDALAAERAAHATTKAELERAEKDSIIYADKFESASARAASEFKRANDNAEKLRATRERAEAAEAKVARVEALAAELRSSERGVPGYFTQGYTAGLERAGERLAALLAETGDTE